MRKIARTVQAWCQNVPANEDFLQCFMACFVVSCNYTRSAAI